MPISGSRSGLITASAFFVAALGVFGAISSYQVSSSYAAQFPDAYGADRGQIRFAPLAGRVPLDAELGYVTDLPPSSPAAAPAFLSAQYAVAPRVLLALDEGARPEWAVGNFSQPADFAAVGETRGYALVADLGNGVVLYHRK